MNFREIRDNNILYFAKFDFVTIDYFHRIAAICPLIDCIEKNVNKELIQNTQSFRYIFYRVGLSPVAIQCLLT